MLLYKGGAIYGINEQNQSTYVQNDTGTTINT